MLYPREIPAVGHGASRIPQSELALVEDSDRRIDNDGEAVFAVERVQSFIKYLPVHAKEARSRRYVTGEFGVTEVEPSVLELRSFGMVDCGVEIGLCADYMAVDLVFQFLREAHEVERLVLLSASGE